MLDVEGLASSAELESIEAGTVVREHTAGVDAEAPEPVGGAMQEVDGGDRLLVGIGGGEGKPRVVIDGDVEELPARAAGLVPGVAVMRWPARTMRASFLISMCSRSPGAGCS